MKVDSAVPLLALTATATEELIKNVKKKFLREIPPPVIKAKNPIRTNTKFIYVGSNLRKFRMLYYWIPYILMETADDELYLIFCRSTSSCGEIYTYCIPLNSSPPQINDPLE